MKTLASIAYALRYFNMTEEEEAAEIPRPWSYQNIPVAVAKQTIQSQRFGRGEQPLFIEVIEVFEDGSKFARSA